MRAWSLVTGFEPFGGSTVNSSELVVNALSAARLPGVVTAVLPTSYRRAGVLMTALMRQHRPSQVFMLGLAQSSAAIRFEEVAQNLDDCAAPDNDGEIRLGRCIIEEAPEIYGNTLPLDWMSRVARGLGEKTTVSRDAGGFVCNHVFFTTAHLMVTEFPEIRCGFVHLPAVPQGSKRLNRIVDLVGIWATDKQNPGAAV